MKARTVLERHTYICLGVLLTFSLQTQSQVSDFSILSNFYYPIFTRSLDGEKKIPEREGFAELFSRQSYVTVICRTFFGRVKSEKFGKNSERQLRQQPSGDGDRRLSWFTISAAAAAPIEVLRLPRLLGIISSLPLPLLRSRG